MLDQNLWAICGFGSGLNISFLTHQCLGSTEPVTSEVWKQYIYRHVLTVKTSKIISNVVVSSFIIIYHHLSRSFDCNLENVPNFASRRKISS